MLWVSSIFCDSDLARGKAQKRISLKGKQVSDDSEIIKASADIPNTTDVMKAGVLKINEDVLVHPKIQVIKELKNVAAAFACPQKVINRWMMLITLYAGTIL